MRWKLLRRRLSISAPRMIVRSHLPWPLRWALLAVMFGFSAAIALWAFEFGKDIAGLDRVSQGEIKQLRSELAQLREERDKAQSIANTAESLLRTEQAAQNKLAEQLRQLEAEKLALKADLGVFERLLPAGNKGDDGVTVRAFQVEPESPLRWRYQVLVMQGGRQPPLFSGRYELTLSGMLDGKPWTLSPVAAAAPVQVRQYARVEGHIDVPARAVVKTATVRIIDSSGAVRSTQTTRLGQI